MSVYYSTVVSLYYYYYYWLQSQAIEHLIVNSFRANGDGYFLQKSRLRVVFSRLSLSASPEPDVIISLTVVVWRAEKIDR